MSAVLLDNKRYTINKGSVIYQKGSEISEISILLSGKVKIINEYIEINVNQGTLLGLTDSGNSKYIFNYIAAEDCELFSYKIGSVRDIESILNSNRNISGIVVSTINRHTITLSNVYKDLIKETNGLFNVLKDGYSQYLNFCNNYFIDKMDLNAINALLPPIMDSEGVDLDEVKYCEELLKLPPDLIKQFYGLSSCIATHAVSKIASTAAAIDSSSGSLIKYLYNNYPLLIGENKNNLFNAVSGLIYEMKSRGEDTEEPEILLSKIIDVIKHSKKSDKELFKTLYANHIERMKNLETGEDLGTDISFHVNFAESEIIEAKDNIQNSLDKILEYSDWETPKAVTFKNLISLFRNMPDRKIADKESSLIRRQIGELFYELYELVFFKAENDENLNPIINMFLSFGYVDEKLIGEEQAIALYHINVDDASNVFTIRQWLSKIYNGEKEPSRNEFDIDYEQNLREIKKTRNVSEDEERDYLNDNKNKVHYEIQNMFKSANKMTFGLISKFCPVLSDDNIVRELEKSIVTASEINSILDDILEIDFTAFCREIIFHDPEHGVNQEFIRKSVLPEFILLPNIGSRAVMWQEIEGKKKDSPARFLFPLFSYEDINDLLIGVIGRFRWELCKNIQGYYWNNILERSLTSEYCDYLQFYRKNRELADAAKEKIKTNLHKKCNNYKEMFVSEYEQWIKYESTGVSRLTISVRRILFTYCPFRQEIREQLKTNPMFKGLIDKYERDAEAKIRRFNNVNSIIEKNNGLVTKDLLDNIEFYKL